MTHAPCSFDSRRRERTRLRLSGCSCWRCSRGWCIPAGNERRSRATGRESRQMVHRPGVRDAARRTLDNLFVSTVAFLSVLQVAIAAALPAVHGSGVGHVEEALSTAGVQVALQLPQVAVVEHARERMPEDQGGREATEGGVQINALSAVLLGCSGWCLVPSGSRHDAASVVSAGLAAVVHVVAHAKVVAHLVRHGGCHTHG